MGCVAPNGYGLFTLGKLMGAHRASHRLFKGPIGEGLVVDHLCKVTCCVNPQHLEVVTQAENVARGDTGKNERDKTHCPQGHEYSDSNTYRLPNGKHRYCRACRVEYWKHYVRPSDRSQLQ